MVVLVLLLLTVITSLLLAVIVSRSAINKRLNRYLAVFTLFISVWALGDILMLYARNAGVAQLGANLFYVGPMITTLFLLFFADTLPQGAAISRKLFYGAIAVTAGLAGLILLDQHFLLRQIIIQPGRNIVVPHQGLPLNLYAGFFNLFFVVTYVKLILRYRRNRGVLRSQVLIMLIGITVSSAAAVTTNLTLPQHGHYDLVWCGPIFTLFFAATTILAIVRHRMFDVRLIIVRSIAYGLSLTSIAAMYVGFSYLVSSILSAQAHDGRVPPVVNAVLLLIAAISFGPLKQRFDKVTNRIFYRDAYNAAALFSQLNSMLVASVDMPSLATESLRMLEATLKPDFTAIGLRDAGGPARVFSPSNVNFSAKDIERVSQLTPAMGTQKVIVAEYLDDKRQLELKRIMVRTHIEVIVRLTPSTYSAKEGLGYLVLGAKKSGNFYTQQDISVLDTVGNELTIAIQNILHYEEIQKFNLILQGRVNEATRKISRTNDKLKALDETKDDFISMASHQLRTPLTAVKGYLSMVLEGDAGDINDTQRKMLGQAYTSSQRMVYLIADLLNVSRLRTGKFVMESGPTDLSQMINEELAQLTEAAAARSLTLKYNQPASFPSLMLDETKTRQVLMNFIDNAIYYTPKGGHVKIELRDSGPTVEFKVIDDGIGVPKSEQHHLFTKFYRAANARQARPDGTGLGLFMAKKVISAQNGALIFDSKEGQGSTFGFTFTKSKLAATAAEAAKDALAVPHTPVQDR